MSNKVIHFEIPSDNPEKSMEFFNEVFNWKFQQFGNEEYWSVITGDEKDAGINRGLMKKRDPKQPVVNSIEVASVDEYINKIEKAGGKIVMPKMAVPSVGWLAYFKDTDDNIHGIFQNDSTANM